MISKILSLATYSVLGRFEGALGSDTRLWARRFNSCSTAAQDQPFNRSNFAGRLALEFAA
jgi:hypothetical protein